MFDIHSILSALRRNKIAAALIVAEIAVACAFLPNAVFVIFQQIQRVNITSGTAENEIVDVFVRGSPESSTESAGVDTEEDARLLAAIPGVRAVTFVNQVPFGGAEWRTGIMLQPDQKEEAINASMYMGSEGFLDTLGLRLIAGRSFHTEEFQWYSADTQVSSAILTRSAAQALFPGKSGVGEIIYIGNSSPVTVVGIVDVLLRPKFGTAESSNFGFSIILPLKVPYVDGSHYVMRSSEQLRAQVLQQAEATLESRNSGRILLALHSMQELRSSFFQQERSMVRILVVVCFALLTVTGLGIFGLTSVWMQRRAHQIGIRRALGATRGQVIAHFMLENLTLAVAGIAAGITLAYTISTLLTQNYALPRLPLFYLIAGLLAALVLDQLSVLAAALRAARIPPTQAIRAL